MPCCQPVECRDCQPRRLGEGDSDSCLCGFFYLNGVLAGILAQFLLASGLLFSVATVGDCSLIETTLHLDLPGEEFFGQGEGFNYTTNLGLLFFSKPNGDCYWYDIGNFPENQFEWYLNDATPDWHVARGFSALGVAIGLVLFLYSLSVTCSAQKRGMRRFIAFVSSVALACIQCLTFLVFPTEFCDSTGCRASRTASFCTVSACLYFWGGICFLFMSDYPGTTLLEEEKMSGAIHQKPTEPMEDNEPIVAAYARTTGGDDQLHQISPESSVEMETYSLDPENPLVNNESNDDSFADVVDPADDATTHSDSPYVESEPDKVLEAKETLEADQKSEDKNDNDLEAGSTAQEKDEPVPQSTIPTETNPKGDVAEEDGSKGQESNDTVLPSIAPTATDQDSDEAKVDKDVEDVESKAQENAETLLLPTEADQKSNEAKVDKDGEEIENNAKEGDDAVLPSDSPTETDQIIDEAKVDKDCEEIESKAKENEFAVPQSNAPSETDQKVDEAKVDKEDEDIESKAQENDETVLVSTAPTAQDENCDAVKLDKDEKENGSKPTESNETASPPAPQTDESQEQ